MTTINPMIAALASEAATGELQNVKVGGGPFIDALHVDLAKVNAALKAIAGYKVGDGRETLLEIEEYVRRSQYDKSDRASVASRLGAVIAGTGSKDSKAFACRQLWIIGTAAEVPVLAEALKDPTLSDMARYALQNLGYVEAEGALVAALNDTDPKVQIGVINSLAQHIINDHAQLRSPEAIDAIKSLKKSKDKDVAEAAKHAVGRLEGKIVP